eukprot:TRINITY_DN11926_c0_g5_i1.p1 TRINITY_DN11926_c0_g5~~TRINITY_DN11926_c0_g5_i1.p1  ORF type:complete len:1645 (+),score=348.44 TRINITY_DN11926_c0_g5_i1:37-4971(+)
MGATRQKKAAAKKPLAEEDEAPLVGNEETPMYPPAAVTGVYEYGEQAVIPPDYDLLTKRYSSEEPIPHHMMRMFLMYLSGNIDKFALKIKQTKGKEINMREFTSICATLLKNDEIDDKRKAACCGLLDPMQFGQQDPGDCEAFLEDVFSLLDLDNDTNLTYKELNICTKDFGNKLARPSKEFPRLKKALDGQTTPEEKRMVCARLGLLKKLRQEVLLEREKQLARLASVDLNAGQVSLFVNKLDECGWIQRAFDEGRGLVTNVGKERVSLKTFKRALESGEVDYCLPNATEQSKGRSGNSKFHILFDNIDRVIAEAVPSMSDETTKEETLDYADQFRKGVYRYVSSIVGDDEEDDFHARFSYKQFALGIVDEADGLKIGTEASANIGAKSFWTIVKGNDATRDAAEQISFMMENYPIKSSEFIFAYEAATGVSIQEDASTLGCCNPTYPLWKQLETLYDGQLNYEEFFKYLTRGNTSDAGGIAFGLHYATRKTQRLRNCEYFLIYFIFLVLYSIFVQTDLDSAKAFYLRKDIDDHVTDDEAQFVNGDRNYFPWGFDDIANSDDLWSWLTSNVISYVWSEDGLQPGFQVVQGRTNRIIGGLRLHQYRQEPMNCKDDSDRENLADTGTCPDRTNTGDARQATDWLDINQYLTEGGSTAYSSNVCLSPLFGYDRNDNSDRTFRVCVANRHNTEVAGEVFKVLVEERLRGVAVQSSSGTSSECVAQLSSGSVDAVIGAWTVDLATAFDTTNTDYETLANHPFPKAQMHTWMPREYQRENCETCASRGWAALAESFQTGQKNAGNTVTYIDAPAHLGWKTNMNVLLEGYRIGGDVTKWNQHVVHLDKAGSTYINYMTSLNKGKSFFYGDDELGKAYGATKMEQEEYLSEQFASEINTYIRADIKERFVDVYQLLKYMSWGTASQFSKDIAAGTDISASACEWVKANEPTWAPWIRTPNHKDIETRMNQFNVKCYGAWINDDISESRTSFLDVRDTMTRDELVKADFPDGNYAKKIYDVEGGELQETYVYAPTREVFFQNIAAAELGDYDAQQAWSKTQAWVWRSCGEMNSEAGIVPYRGKVQPRESVTFYKCNGYGTFLPISKTKIQIKQELDTLRLNNWIDLATRGIMLEFFVHSQNSRQIARFQYMVEVSAEGAYIPTINIVTFFLFQPETIKFAGLWYTGLVLLTFAYIYLVLQFVVKFGRDNDLELKAMRREGGSNHGSQWPCTKTACSFAYFSRYIGNIISKISMLTMFNYIQLTFLSMFFLGWVVRVVIFAHGMTASSLFCTDRYPEHLGYVANMYTILQNVEGFSIVLVYINLMSFMEDIEYFSRVSKTIVASARMVGILVLSLIISLMAFAAGVWILFSSDVEQRLGIWQAMTASVLMTLDTLDTSWMSEAQPNVTLFLFILFYVIVQAVILNVMIGILSDNFETVFKNRFREDEFREIIKHDPNCTTWGDPSASWVGVILFRDFPRAMCCANTYGRHRYLLWQKNFWKRYSQTLQNFDSFSVQANLCAFQELLALDKEFCSGKQERCVYQEEGSDESDEYSFLQRRTMKTFIERNLEASRVRLLEHILIIIPCSYLSIDLGQAWADVLMEHKNWRLHNEKWARFEPDEFESLIASIKRETLQSDGSNIDFGASSTTLKAI